MTTRIGGTDGRPPADEGASVQPADSVVQPSIGDYGIIGDCRSAGLISNSGSIDWLCWPRFDKAAIFARLLDTERGGYWRIGPPVTMSCCRRYIPETNVLQTSFKTSTGCGTLTDLMPIAGELLASPALAPDYEIVRRFECTEGEMEVELDFVPRSEYGIQPVRIRQTGKLGLRMEVGRGVYWLRGSCDLRVREHSAHANVALRAGDILNFSFSYAEESPAVLPALDDGMIVDKTKTTAQFWQTWAKRAEYDGEYRDEVVRSALALKLMCFAPSGAIVAAPTTSLPERIGSSLNWDYRYCWLRDSSLTIRALLELGYWEEASDFLGWLLHATRLTQPELRVLYNVYGETPQAERELALSGYRGSRPVRVGNAAREQFQLDVYGEVIDAAAQFASHGGTLDKDTQKALIRLGNYVVKHWAEPDDGIWEPRKAREHHTHSRLLCWTALDRLVTMDREGQIRGAPVEIYKHHEETIRGQIESRAWNEQMQSYVSILDGNELDASLLLLSWYGFEKAGSPRMRSTHRAIVEQLGTSNGLLFRYRNDVGEGAFAICSFWEAEYLAMGGGSLQQAHVLFRRLLGLRNHLGLCAEEIDPRTGDALGNFPQAFTHIGLIGAALSIRQREKGKPQLVHRADSADRAKGQAGVRS